jgi:hypothetical protein
MGSVAIAAVEMECREPIVRMDFRCIADYGGRRNGMVALLDAKTLHHPSRKMYCSFLSSRYQGRGD